MIFQEKNAGANDGARTRDNRYHKPALYQLSYIRHTASAHVEKRSWPVKTEMRRRGKKFRNALLRRRGAALWQSRLCLQAARGQEGRG